MLRIGRSVRTLRPITPGAGSVHGVGSQSEVSERPRYQVLRLRLSRTNGICHREVRLITRTSCVGVKVGPHDAPRGTRLRPRRHGCAPLWETPREGTAPSKPLAHEGDAHSPDKKLCSPKPRAS